MHGHVILMAYIPCVFQLSYIAFLLLFSYILIVSFKPEVSVAEIVLMVWVFTIFTEEIRQVGR